ncbi:hypothetical protein AWB70_07547 [Caballeronia cordobensis]|uniref:Uncharacterized protein n=1 Tax=Caballeronia cordobensis TaxID=1353886 RepID=A0A158JUU0_CABCO|nr:hypothetical protein AWB70_07547 [Caballeronia cordobensis]
MLAAGRKTGFPNAFIVFRVRARRIARGACDNVPKPH